MNIGLSKMILLATGYFLCSALLFAQPSLMMPTPHKSYGLPIIQAFDQADLIISFDYFSNATLEVKKIGVIPVRQLFKTQDFRGVLNPANTEAEIDISDFSDPDATTILFSFTIDRTDISQWVLYLKRTHEHKYRALRCSWRDSLRLVEKYPLEKITDPEKLIKKARNIWMVYGQTTDNGAEVSVEKAFLERYVLMLFKMKKTLNKKDFVFFRSLDQMTSTKTLLKFDFATAHPWGYAEIEKRQNQIIYRYYDVDQVDPSKPLVNSTFKNVFNHAVTFTN